MTTPFVAPNIQKLKPYVPGKPIEEVQRELGLQNIIKLASNENPLGASPEAMRAFAESCRSLALYPEGSAPVLRAAVAKHRNMPEETIIFGNGSDEVLHLLTLAYLQPGDEVVQGDPSFAMYEIYTQLSNGVSVKVPLNNYVHDLPAMADAITDKTQLIMIANPNNPTGTLVESKEIEQFLSRVPPHVIVVFDEAYDEYVNTPNKADLRPIIQSGANVVILHTFSKAYGLAGLRVGYGIARPEIVETLNRVRSPFNVNLPAQAAAVAALQDQKHVQDSVELNQQGLGYLYQEFTRLGLEYVPSQANFVLVDVKRDSRKVFDSLLRQGIIIRAGAGLGLPNHIRVTVGKPEQNARFISALEYVLNNS